MSRYVFDIEADDLLIDCTQVWIIHTINISTLEKRTWYPYRGDTSWKKVFDEAKQLIGHNICGFDLPALEKLFGYRPPKDCAITDTVIMSQVLDYRRFGAAGHSLEAWGASLGAPKDTFSDFSQYSLELERRCVQDVEINLRVYQILVEEIKRLAPQKPEIKTYLRAENAVATWMAKAQLHGWPFDVKRATELQSVFEEELALAYNALNSRLGTKTVATDKVKGVVETKKPKWLKNGFYDHHTCKWFNIEPPSGYEGEERMVEGEYCRVEFLPLSLDSVADAKVFLFRNGWEPTEWNYDEVTGEKKSPKITEDSLEFLGGDGKLYSNFLVAKSRHSIVSTWLKNTDANGMLHGDSFTIGTPSMRMRHSIIVNVPSTESKWGPEMRELFISKPGWVMIGCDSAGNQARGLAHYLNNAEFTDALINGDIHTYNAGILDNVLKKMGVSWDTYLQKEGLPPEQWAKRKRAAAKRILYAFLFGASGAKLWSYIFGVLNVQQGNKLKAGFTKAVPGFKELLDKLGAIYGSTSKTGRGYIPSIAGNKIYVDSFHKLLVYLLQSCEKATCAAAVMLTMERLEEENIPYIPLIMMHDEEDFMVPIEHAERAAAIGKQAFIDGPKLFGINIMDGDAKIGNNWLEVH